MALNRQFETQGNFLFRWRSFVPFAFIPLAFMGAVNTPSFADGNAPFLGRMWDLLCILLSFSGLGMRCLVVGFAPAGTSGRNTSEQRANFLNTTGAYSMVRNPLYVANFIMFLGLMLFIKDPCLVLCGTLAYVMYYERIVFAEEAFLTQKYGDDYKTWAAKTPAMIPNPFLWQKPAISFSWRTVLRREYNGVALLASLFYLLEWADRYLNDTTPDHFNISEGPGPYWIAMLIAGWVCFLTLRTLKKHTRLLHVTGR